MHEAKPISSPMSSNTVLSQYGGMALSDPSTYRSVVASLQYLSLTRPDIAFRLCRVGSNALQFLVGKLSKVVTAGASWQSSQHQLAIFILLSLPSSVLLFCANFNMVSEQIPTVPTEPIAPTHTEIPISAGISSSTSTEIPVPPVAPTFAGSMDDSNPCLLTNGDNPGLSLVTQPLIGENYQTWSRSMAMALVAKNKAGFVNGSIKAVDSSSPQYGSWKRCDTMVLSWLLNSLSKEISASVIYLDTAFEVWQDLKERFSQSNGPRVYQLQKAIASLNQEQSSVSAFYTKLKGFWDELMNFRPIPACNCGALKTLLDYQRSEYVMKFLVGLNDSYASIRGQILLMEPLPTINKVFALVSQEERQRELTSGPMMHADNSGPTVLAVANYKPYGGNKNFGRKERPVCSHCGITGHIVEKCYKIHGYPPGYKSRARLAANQVTASTVGHYDGNTHGNASLPITSEQCHQLISFLNSQMANEASTSTHQAATIISHPPNFSEKPFPMTPGSLTQVPLITWFI
uniref:Retrotransposon Copia-like N-terminal domain-containing protein n=1 Tax=Fagus sylvatica TaxID=28930 RepID=A0A2N9F6C1_FAGSY